ncbi:sensor histidine kinase [Pedobacter aquatilis]|uniref:sensor histidine kinase n=1 Tax=Pedobacter aquatilis TaxID=351343 RepID=UPI00292D667B|nr:sensor histidine kinase [Pedobacter aquatilis]
MRNHIFLLLLFISISYSGKAQLSKSDQKYVDSLNKVLIGNLPDSAKAAASFNLVSFWADTDSLKAVTALNKGRKFGGKDPLLSAKSFWFESMVYQDRDYEKAQKLLIKADAQLQKFENKKIYKTRSMVWHNYSLILQHKDDMKGMIDILIHRVIPLSKKAGDKVFLGTEYISVGTVFSNLGQFEKAIPYFNQGINLLKNVPPGQRYLLINAYISISDNYCQIKNYKLTNYYLNLTKTTLQESEGSEFGSTLDIFWLEYYKGLTRYSVATKKYTEALASAQKAIELATKTKDNYSLQETLFEKYKVFFALKKYSEAKNILLQIIDKAEFNSLATNSQALKQSMAEVNFATHDFKEAYLWLKKSNDLKDSLDENKLKEDINALELRYKEKENRQEIANLNIDKAQNALIIKKSKTTTLLLIAASFFLLVIIILLLIYYRNYKKLAEQRAINFQQQVADLEQKQQLEIGRAMLNAEEKERNRVAQDLHDGLGGMLSGLKINLSNWAKQRETELPDVELQRIVKQLDGSVTELRHIARNMMPQTLLKFGLEVALKDLSESAMSNEVHVDFQALNISKNIALEEQIIIYRIVQEMLTNTLKHAKASEVVLQCSENEHYFYITIEDNGIGFDTAIYKKGLGLENIKNRVAYLRGSFEIDSQLENGTTINIEIPIRYE